MKKDLKNKELARMLRDIRPFVNFKYNLNEPITKYKAAKIRKYHKAIAALRARPNYIYRPRKKDNLKPAQQFAQHSEYLPGLKVAFIPTQTPGKKPKIKFNSRGEISVTEGNIKTILIPLDKYELFENPKSHIKEQLKKYPDYDSFTVSAGEYEIPNGHNRKSLVKEIIFLMEKYGEKGGLSEEDNHYWGNWLNSVRGYSFKNQKSFGEYLAVKQKAKKSLQRKNRNLRRKQKYYDAKNSNGRL